MKSITCEHCGCAIHLDTDKICPNCKAPYKDNKEYLAYKEMDKKEREQNLKTKEIANDIMKDSRKNAKGVFILAFFIIFAFLITFIISITTMSHIGETMEEEFNKNNPIKLNDTEEKEEEKQVKFNETASMKKYDIICDEVREYKYDWYEDEHTKAGTKYYAFHLVIKNKTDKMIATKNFKVVYTDEKGNEGLTAKEVTFPNQVEKATQLNSYVDSNLSISGNIYFELPKYVKEVQIIFENVKINVTLK